SQHSTPPPIPRHSTIRWLQALLPVYFTLFDTNLDGKLTGFDVSPLGVLIP
ncbi:hypothetical protein Bpfe_014896, partial [Biomphalaria pfeifferi]